MGMAHSAEANAGAEMTDRKKKFLKRASENEGLIEKANNADELTGVVSGNNRAGKYRKFPETALKYLHLPVWILYNLRVLI